TAPSASPPPPSPAGPWPSTGTTAYRGVVSIARCFITGLRGLILSMTSCCLSRLCCSCARCRLRGGSSLSSWECLHAAACKCIRIPTFCIQFDVHICQCLHRGHHPTTLALYSQLCPH